MPTDGSSRDGSRKRIKTSREGTLAARATIPSIKAPTTATMSTGDGAASSSANSDGTPCHHQQALKSLHTDIDAMRQLVTCQICHRFMYEPYALSCGHTYCYSCLAQWLPSNRKKTCPDCRTQITQQPTPSYIIRELVLIFVSRSQLLPDGETAEEHDTIAKEEAEIVAKDKANTDHRNGGLFKGCFNHGRPLFAMHDPGDGVDRCPRCHWEVEDGFCEQCGIPVGEDGLGFSDYDDDSLDSDEVDEDLNEVDAEDGLGHPNDVYDYSGSEGHDVDPRVLQAAFGVAPGHRNRRSVRSHRIRLGMESDEDDEEEDEHDSDLEQFIDDDDGMGHYDSDSDSSEDTAVQENARRPRHNRRSHVVISDDEEAPHPPTAAAMVISDSEPSSDEDSDEEGPVTAGSQRNKRRVASRQRSIAVSSEDSESDNTDNESIVVDRTRPAAASFSPLQSEDHNGTSSRVDSESDDEDDHLDLETARFASSTEPEAGLYNGAYDDHDDNSDDEDGVYGVNGWDIPSEAAASSDPRHRLGTNLHRRNRFTDAFPGQPSVATSRASPERLQHRRIAQPHRSLRRQPIPSFRGPPTNGGSAPSVPRSRPAHPFQLSETLANINNAIHHDNPRERIRPRNRNFTASTATSSPASTGGVDVSLSSANSGSSGGRSHIDESTPFERAKQLRSGVVERGLFRSR